MDTTTCGVRVYARFRPAGVTGAAEREETAASDVKLVDGTSVILGKSSFSFDGVWDPSISQDQVHNLVGKAAVDDVLMGYNSTIFAYGQTGSGKTFTMYGGSSDSGDSAGLIPRVTSYLFERIESGAAAEGASDPNTAGVPVEYTIKCSCVEIYNETVRDLLNPTSTDAVRIRETTRKGVWLEGATAICVSSQQEVMKIVKSGAKFRATSKTDMNERSSRSHSLFIMTLIQVLSDGSSKVSQLNLVDLAGSERLQRSGATGVALQEARSINQSLSALGNVIQALTDSGRSHVPYRDSRLTHLLKESLGGNTKTVLIVTGTLAEEDREETVSTLRFGTRAKSIHNVVHINKEMSPDELRSKVDALMKYVHVLEKENADLKGRLAESATKSTEKSLKKPGSDRRKGDLLSPQRSGKLGQPRASVRSAASVLSRFGDDDGTAPGDGDDDDVLAPSQTASEFFKMRAELDALHQALAELESDLASERAQRQNAEAELECVVASGPRSFPASIDSELSDRLMVALRQASEAEARYAKQSMSLVQANRQIASLQEEVQSMQAHNTLKLHVGAPGETIPAVLEEVAVTDNLPPFPEAGPDGVLSLEDLSAHLRARRLAMEANLERMLAAPSGSSALEPTTSSLDARSSSTPAKQTPQMRKKASSSHRCDDTTSKELLTELDDANRRIISQADRIQYLQAQLEAARASHGDPLPSARLTTIMKPVVSSPRM